MERELFLDSLRAVAITMVVAIHAAIYVDLQETRYFALFEMLTETVAVPIFFACDGFLFEARALRHTRLADGDYVRKSARRLLLPWLVFSLIYLLVRAAFEWAGVVEPVVLGQGPGALLAGIYNSEVASQLYFLPALFVVRLVATLLPVRFRQMGRWWLLAAGLGYLLLFSAFRLPLLDLFHHGEGSAHGKDPLLHAVWGLQFFVAGMLVFRFRAELKAWWRGVSAMLLSLLLLMLWSGASSHAAEVALGYVYLLLLFTVFMAKVRGNGLLPWIGGHTMEIFLLHSPIMVKAVALAVLAWVATDPLPALAWVTLLTLVLSLLLARQLRRLPILPLAFGDLPRGRAAARA